MSVWIAEKSSNADHRGESTNTGRDRLMQRESVPYFLVYDDAFDEGASWMTPLSFHKRSKQIARALIANGYYGDIGDEDEETRPTGS